jgi:hypothetical protein
MLSFICVVLTKKGIEYSQFMHDAILSFIITTGREQRNGQKKKDKRASIYKTLQRKLKFEQD